MISRYLTAKKINLRNSKSSVLGPFRMTSMVDIIFLLLIFFLLTANFRPLEDYLPINTPAKSQKSNFGKVEPLIISVKENQDRLIVSIDQKNLEIKQGSRISELKIFINSILKNQERTNNDPVEIACSKNLSWQNLVNIYNCLFDIGITDISFQTIDE